MESVGCSSSTIAHFVFSLSLPLFYFHFRKKQKINNELVLLLLFSLKEDSGEEEGEEGR